METVQGFFSFLLLASSEARFDSEDKFWEILLPGFLLKPEGFYRDLLEDLFATKDALFYSNLLRFLSVILEL